MQPTSQSKNGPLAHLLLRDRALQKVGRQRHLRVAVPHAGDFLEPAVDQHVLLQAPDAVPDVHLEAHALELRQVEEGGADEALLLDRPEILDPVRLADLEHLSVWVW